MADSAKGSAGATTTAVTDQPQAGSVSDITSPCPPGLEALDNVEIFAVSQKLEIIETVSGKETKNQYTIKDGADKTLYSVKEVSDLTTTTCCGGIRAFTMSVSTTSMLGKGKEVAQISCPEISCAGCCCWCISCGCGNYVMNIEAPVGTGIGSIKQSPSCFGTTFSLSDATGTEVLLVKSPCCVCSGVCCTCDFDFKIYSTGAQSKQIGSIIKRYGGIAKELLTDATKLNVSVPTDLDVKMKLVVLSTALLVDMMFFEDSKAV